MKHRRHNLPERLARTVFRWQAPLLLVATVATSVEHLLLHARNPILANALFPMRVEYILASLAILFGSMLLAAHHERDLCGE